MRKNIKLQLSPGLVAC